MPKETPGRYATLVEKDPSDLHVRFADWIADQTGIDRDEIDLKSVQLACTLRMDFQRSPENQEVLATRREAAELNKERRAEAAKERAANKVLRDKEREEAKAARAAAKAAQDAAEAEAGEADEDEAPKPKKAAKKTSKKAPVEEAKPVARRRRPAKPAPTAPVEDEDAGDEDFDEDPDL